MTRSWPKPSALFRHPADEGTKMGALVSEPHRDKVLGYIESAKAQGATVLCGGDTRLHPTTAAQTGTSSSPLFWKA